jgi:hypothetical protein
MVLGRVKPCSLRSPSFQPGNANKRTLDPKICIENSGKLPQRTQRSQKEVIRINSAFATSAVKIFHTARSPARGASKSA